MLQARRDAALPQGPLADLVGLALVEALVEEDLLDGDDAPEPLVGPAPDHAHRARADPLLEAIPPGDDTTRFHRPPSDGACGLHGPPRGIRVEVTSCGVPRSGDVSPQAWRPASAPATEQAPDSAGHGADDALRAAVRARARGGASVGGAGARALVGGAGGAGGLGVSGAGLLGPGVLRPGRVG